MNTNVIFKNENITIRRNVQLHGIEVEFPSRPSEFERSLLKDSGFKWAASKNFWWAKESGITERYVENEADSVPVSVRSWRPSRRERERNGFSA